MVRVENLYGMNIQASVSTWGDGMTGLYTIGPGCAEDWKRSDTRGFDLVIIINGNSNTWKIDAHDTIIVQKNGTIKLYKYWF